ncbi:MAG: inositol monophosphatase [Paracoccaceae bacterium]|nr:inositol monophosphatase [Paracoccaceae bacterium]
MPLTESIVDGLIQAVRLAARTEIMPRFRNTAGDEIKSKSGPDDLVTIADCAAERVISEASERLLPGALIVGEEAIEEDAGILDALPKAKLAVIIDPIDGTWNFANGLPLFGVILAVVEDDETTFGLLYDPISDAWIRAGSGKGAFYCSSNGTRRRLSINTAGNGTIGVVPLFLFSSSVRKRLAPRLLGFDRVMSLRCSCFEYWLLAEGACDFAIAGLMKPWDHAAGELVYREAGGFAAMLPDGKRYRASRTVGHLLVARNPERWAALREVFAEPVS